MENLVRTGRKVEKGDMYPTEEVREVKKRGIERVEVLQNFDLISRLLVSL